MEWHGVCGDGVCVYGGDDWVGMGMVLFSEACCFVAGARIPTTRPTMNARTTIGSNTLHPLGWPALCSIELNHYTPDIRA